MKHVNQVHIVVSKRLHLLKIIGFIGLIFFLLVGCGSAESGAANTGGSSPLDHYVAKPDASFKYELRNTIEGDGYKIHVVHMVSGQWLTTAEVKDPVWWHWVTIVVPDSLASDTSLLFIMGGSRKNQMPNKAEESFVKIALATGSVVTALHNVPNQPIEFVGDSYGPRSEDEIIAYAWRQYLEAGATEEASRWLPRLPMTNAAVRTMDVVAELSPKLTGRQIDKFVVAGGSKRGWTTWTTAIADNRVVAIMPIVIDMLNLIPSFEHHWQVYGFWAPAVGDYVSEGIMEWQHSTEYQKLTEVVEPYNFRDRITIPKLLINASGDQFFLPDSWQFYWQDLQGEKHIRYVPNANHSLRRTDAIETVAAFHHAIINDKTRPDFDWTVKDGVLHLKTNANQPPISITLWQATNPDARDFRVRTIGRNWTSSEVALREDGQYTIQVDAPENGWTAFLAELTFPGLKDIPLKFSTGVVVVPDMLPYPPYESPAPRGTPSSGN
ncbi:MAG: PhoPQ-activated pathogenicity-like protein PqaA type [Calditrichaeota bacterium]|nr:MAG: PhoPQ-activated pathogenicity-like protein PqaA type [Calditrichota bacterium]